MALVLADRVQQTGTANTTVSFTLSGSVTGFQSFAVIGNTNTTYYSAFDASGNWEVGIGTYSTTGPTLTRTTILASSNSGSAVTFSGSVVIFVTYPSENSVYSYNNIVDLSSLTGALVLPTGTTAQRPASPSVGMARYNSSFGEYEVYKGGNWLPLTEGSYTYSADYLIVAGGGGSSFGGGGAGGLLSGTTTLNIGSVYTVTVGGGGAAAVGSAAGTNGSNSSITGLTTAVGGGGGGALPGAGISGGSGGGGVGSNSGGSATSGQGFSGGTGSVASFNAGGGGGGSGGVGGNSLSGTVGGNAGVGTSNSITGSAVTYAGGGSGASTNGGGQGSTTAGGGSTANLGGGGNCTGAAVNNGGSGVVILSVPTAKYTGTVTGSPTVTTNGSNTVIKFTASGSYTA